LWVLIEEAGDSSPAPASSEEAAWVPTNRLDMKGIREARNKAIADMEEAAQERWESFSINSYVRGW
jgi:hypothetical protein